MNKPILDKSMAITRGALPGSNKLLVNGVPFREVKLSGGEPPVRIGEEVYKIFHLSNRDGRKLELRVSHDDCHTWKPAL